jgi:uncharacterized protein (DUF433 family)
MHDHYITSDPGGRPVIAGTHVTVEEVLEELAAWGEIDRVLTAHPELDRNAVRAALAYAADRMHETATQRTAPHADKAHQPFWERFLDASRRIPDEELDRLPPDLAAQVDHYIYGTPKR